MATQLTSPLISVSRFSIKPVFVCWVSTRRKVGHATKQRKRVGLAAKDYVVDWCEAQEAIKIQTSLDKRGKFGRVLGRVIGDGDGCLNDVLVDVGHAEVYDGGKR
jgi:endonuclease YncB( thermonuclease family)